MNFDIGRNYPNVQLSIKTWQDIFYSFGISASLRSIEEVDMNEKI